jgi:hypothetical protein
MAQMNSDENSGPKRNYAGRRYATLRGRVRQARYYDHRFNGTKFSSRRSARGPHAERRFCLNWATKPLLKQI